MDIHKPKPWRGVREFLKEYAIIVVGVLTALAAEQAVEWLHWRAQLAETREALKQEVRSNVDLDVYVGREDGCLLAKLDDYVAWTTGGPKANMEAVSLAFPKADVWEVAKSGQALGHMPLNERLAFARVYGAVENQKQVTTMVREEYNKLSRYAGKQNLTPDEARRLVEDVSEMRVMLRIGRTNSGNMVKQANDLGVRPGPLSATRRQRLEGLCRPTGAT